MRKMCLSAVIVLLAAVLNATAYQPPRPGGPPGPGGPGNFNPGDMFAAGLMKAAGKNKDKDKQFTKEEFLDGAKKVFVKWDKQKKGTLDEKTLAVALNQTSPTLFMPHGGARPGLPPVPPGGTSPGQMIAKVIMTKADVNKNGKFTSDEFVAACETFFKDADKNGDGVLDAKELANGLITLLPPRPGAPTRPGTDK